MGLDWSSATSKHSCGVTYIVGLSICRFLRYVLRCGDSWILWRWVLGYPYHYRLPDSNIVKVCERIGISYAVRVTILLLHPRFKKEKKKSKLFVFFCEITHVIILFIHNLHVSLSWLDIQRSWVISKCTFLISLQCTWVSR